MRLGENPCGQDVDDELEVGVHVLCCDCGEVHSRQLVFPQVCGYTDVGIDLEEGPSTVITFS